MRYLAIKPSHQLIIEALTSDSIFDFKKGGLPETYLKIIADCLATQTNS